jgi:O-antigen/teichoic acid export membrane protein/O-antigen ligase
MTAESLPPESSDQELTVAVKPPKRSRWRSAASRAMGGSLLASGMSQVVLIVSGVLVARSLGPQDRGYLALLVLVSGICCLLGGLGIPSAATYFIARDRRHAREIVASLLGPGLLLTVVTLALQIAVLIPLVMHAPQRVKVAAVVSLLLVPGLRAFAYGTAILQGQQRFTAFNVTRIFPTALYVAAVLAAFLLHSADLVRIMTMWTAANFVGGFFAVGVAVHGLRGSHSYGSAPRPSEVTRFGIKSLFSSLSPVDAFRLDQAAVGLFLTPVALGLYVVAQAVTNLPRIIGYSIGLVAYPQVAAQADVAVARRAMWKYFFIGAGLSLSVVVLLELATGRLILLFFGGEFSGATQTARILLVGTFFMAARRVLTDGVNGLGHPGLGTLAEVSSWVLLVPGLAVLLPKLGLVGVAIALALSWGVSLLLLLFLVATLDTRLSPVRPAQTAARRLRSGLTLLTSEQLVFFGVTVAASAMAGIAVVTLPSKTALVLVATLAAALFFGFGRSTIDRAAEATRMSLARSAAARAERAEASSQDEADLRLPRLLFYLGLVSLAILNLRASGQLSFSDVLFFFSLALACAELVILRRRVSIALPLLLLFGMTLFSLGGLVSTFPSYAAVKSAAVVARLIFLTVFWFWLGTVVLSRREHVNRATTLWVASAAACGGAAALQLVGAHLPFTGTVQFGRSTGFTTQPNELGGVTCIAFVPAVMLAAREALAFPQRMLSYGFLLFVAAGLVLSGSVGALLAAGVGVFVWFSLQRATMHSKLVFATLGVLVVGVVAVQTMRGAATPLQRLNKVTSTSPAQTEGSGTLDSRIATYRVAVRAIKHDPFVGVGLDLASVTRPFGEISYQYDVHNLILGTWYKAGLLGLVGMLTALLAVFKTGWGAICASVSDAERTHAVALLCSVVAFVVFAMSEPVLYARFGWISAALVLALRAVQLRTSQVVDERSHEEPGYEPALAPARS